jgi:signal transduction histidine kinase
MDKEKTMNKNNFLRRQITELPLSALVLFILVWFTYGILFKSPYSGFDFNASNGQVSEVFTKPKQGPSLQEGDVLMKIGAVSWQDHKKNARLFFFENSKVGETVDIIVNRNGTELTIPWKFPGFNQVEFNARFFNIWILAYIFWFFGTAVQLLIRPKDARWALFVAANYLTGLWLIFGSLSAWHLWGSSILLHAITWLLLPVYLHLHWAFPRPFNKQLPKTAWILFYVAGLSFAIAEITQSLPKSLYVLAFLAALFGSIILEVIHFIRQADQRRDVLLLAISIFTAFVPSIGLGVLVITRSAPYIGPGALFALPFMPLAYFYVIYRRQLGGMEVRINRLISLYAFLILIGTGVLMLIIPITSLNLEAGTWIFLGTLFILLTAFIAVTGFPVFQTFVEKRFLGIKLPYQNLQEIYSNRITASTSLSCLFQLLEDEVFPSLLIRQFAFMQASNGNLKTLLAKNVDLGQLPPGRDINQLTSQAGMYLPNTSTDNGWMRLILPLKVGDNIIGFWLLGRRDPDDSYPQAEISILQSLANQTAIALSNILHTEQLRKMYQLDIERYEKERMHLALDLHDSILNQLAILRNNIDDKNLSPQFQTAYEELTHRLREIVTDLRPPMLMYGLKPAVEELADNLMERSGDSVRIAVAIQAAEERVSQNIEQHLFRIVQEACENALRHSNAANIKIYGMLDSQKVDLTVEDDGKGFDINDQLELDTLLANNHFGLAGIVERAHLIDGEITLRSTPQKGTTIQITWKNTGK